MNEVRMPALTGTSPLGVMAAMGVLRLLCNFAEPSTRLRWDQDGLVAVLCGNWRTADEVVAALVRIVAEIADDSILPGVPAGFPPPGAAPDALRVPQDRLSRAAHTLTAGMSPAAAEEASRWLSALVTDLAADAQQGRVAISQFTAPSGKQSMATMLTKPLEMLRSEPDYLKQALTGWRRVSGVTGEYLDHRAMWDATEDGGGRDGGMRGVPGATWLALMAIPLTRTTSIAGGRPRSSGWHVVIDGRRRYDELRLPVWGQALGPSAVTALVEHPALVDMRTVALEALGILHVCRARRRQPAGGKSAGVLTTVA